MERNAVCQTLPPCSSLFSPLYSSLVILSLSPTWEERESIGPICINIGQMGPIIVPVRKLCGTNCLLLNQFIELYKVIQKDYMYMSTFSGIVVTLWSK